MYVRVYACVCMHVYVCMYVCMYVCYMYVCMYTRLPGQRMPCPKVGRYVYLFVCMYVCMYVYVLCSSRTRACRARGCPDPRWVGM
jgi:hypothetical protein